MATLIKNAQKNLELKGSETEKNLMKAFAGESQARNRYTFFAEQARAEGYLQIASIFEETANQERAHAMRYFSHLVGGLGEVHASYPAGFENGLVGTTAQNLESAAEGEREEHSILYPSFADVAEQEGFKSAAQAFRSICIAEQHHERRYLDLLENLEKGLVFKKDTKVKWHCMNCGYIHEGLEAPKKCPACQLGQEWYELFTEKF